MLRVAAFIGCTMVTKVVFTDYKHPVYKGRLDASDEVAIVTGADKADGAAVSYHLAQRKARVIMACEDMEKCKYNRRRIVYRTRNRKLACRQLDLTSYRSINEFADNIIEREPRVTILINQSTVRAKDFKRHVTVEGVELHLAHNFLGPYLLTTRLLDKLKQAPKGARIVNVIGKPKRNWDIRLDDLNSERKYSRNAAYCQSKLALALFTRKLAQEASEERNRLFVYATDPGGTMRIENIGKEHSSTYYNAFKIFFLDVLMINSDQVASKTSYCALEPQLAGHMFAGRLYGKRFKLLPWQYKTNDKELQTMICKVAERWVHREPQ